MIRPRKHKSQVKQDLRALKATMRVFYKIQINLPEISSGKELGDIPHYLKEMSLTLSLSHRDVFDIGGTIISNIRSLPEMFATV
ncbi:MAG: hypothetical protein ACP5FZ_08920 [Fidelibacterota bacterium]